MPCASAGSDPSSPGRYRRRRKEFQKGPCGTGPGGGGCNSRNGHAEPGSWARRRRGLGRVVGRRKVRPVERNQVPDEWIGRRVKVGIRTPKGGI